MQDKAEAKLKTLEQRAQEQQKARLAADEEWRHQQRERELARLHVCHSCCRHCYCTAMEHAACSARLPWPNFSVQTAFKSAPLFIQNTKLSIILNTQKTTDFSAAPSVQVKLLDFIWQTSLPKQSLGACLVILAIRWTPTDDLLVTGPVLNAFTDPKTDQSWT